MADSEDFVAIAFVLERTTSLNELQARGLVRRLLKQAGLGASEVTAAQLTVVGNLLLREALAKNGVADIDKVVTQWLDSCAKQVAASRTSERMLVSNTVEEVFARLGLRRK